MKPMERYWEAFGWDVHSIDGHDMNAITDTVASLNTRSGPPHVLIAQTIFGKGVSFMSNEIAWHYLPMSEEQYRQAIAEVEAST